MILTPAPSALPGDPWAWAPERPRLRPLRLLATWAVSALGLAAAVAIVPGAELSGFAGAVAIVAVVAVLNAVVPPVVAALRVPFTLAVGLLVMLVLDAAMLLAAAELAPDTLTVDGALPALVVALLASALSAGAGSVAGIDDDHLYALRVARRVAGRLGPRTVTDAPGIVFLEIDGLALPVLRRAIRDGTTPTMARWLASGTHRLTGWETDLSSQTGAAQAGILLGANDDIPAFRWVDKASRRVVSCASPQDCAALEQRLATGTGLLAGGGTSRGCLLSGEADESTLTVSRLADERPPNPGYRAFLAVAGNVTRTLVLSLWEVALELVAATRQRRRGVVPRGHRGGSYPLIRAGMCVFVRDLVVFSVLQDMFRGVPAIYATFASYDEVAHHSGLERPDTLEALRKLDQRLALIEHTRRYAPRPYELVVLSDHGQTQGATFRQRNGYGLDDLVRRSLGRSDVSSAGGGDENAGNLGRAVGEAVGRAARTPEEEQPDVAGRSAVVLGSGNLGLVSLMDVPRRLTLEEIEARHPALVPALRGHPHVGWVLVRSAAHGPLVLGPRGTRRLADDTVTGEDPLAVFSPHAADHLRRTDGFAHVPDLVVGSAYDPETEEGCAFEELISFHGGLGGPQTEPFVLGPRHLPLPDEPLVGAVAVHRLLREWRALCNEGGGATRARVRLPTAPHAGALAGRAAREHTAADT